MILIKENIQQILFVCIFSQPHISIVHIMKMVIKQHFPHKGTVKNQSIQHKKHQPYFSADAHIRLYKAGWQGNSCQGQQIKSGINIHAPPEAIAEAGK